jgi:hypothetical protein
MRRRKNPSNPQIQQGQPGNNMGGGANPGRRRRRRGGGGNPNGQGGQPPMPPGFDDFYADDIPEDEEENFFDNPPAGSPAPALQDGFENLTPLFPTKRSCSRPAPTNSTPASWTCCPVGKGQRGLIVAPPRTGKTVLMQKMANAISKNNPEVKLIILLIDERPEEVTDMQRNRKAEVISSTFDEPPSATCRWPRWSSRRPSAWSSTAGRRHPARLHHPPRPRLQHGPAPLGKILSGGVDANALHKPKRFFGAARNIEEGGSLTIIATALVDTGSRWTR